MRGSGWRIESFGDVMARGFVQPWRKLLAIDGRLAK